MLPVTDYEQIRKWTIGNGNDEEKNDIFKVLSTELND